MRHFGGRGDTRTRAGAADYVVAVACVGVAAVLGLPFRGHVDPDTLTLFFLVATVVVALQRGLGPGLASAVLGVLAFNFLFVEPYYSLSVFRSSAYLTFALLLATSLAAAAVSTRAVGSLAAARREQVETRLLLALSRDLTAARTLGQVHQVMIAHLSERFEGQVSLHVGTDAGFEHLWQGTERRRAEIAERIAAPHGGMLPLDGLVLQPLEVADDRLGYLVIEEMREETGDPVRRMRIEMAAALVAGAVMRVRQAENAARLRTESDSERLRNLLLSSISHDLRTPLTVLGGTVANLMKMRRKLPREAMEEITSLSLQVGRLQTFTANLLKMAAIASGGLKLKRDAYVLQEVIGAATGRMAERLGGRQLRIAVVGDIPLVDIDGALIDQVITNLVENAIAHTADDGRIQISARRAGDKVEVSVADDGPGLPPGEEGRVFERFRSGATATDRKAIGGTGLGLAICRGIVEAHGGGISAGNGGVLPGAVFTFTLPLFAGEEQVWDDES